MARKRRKTLIVCRSRHDQIHASPSRTRHSHWTAQRIERCPHPVTLRRPGHFGPVDFGQPEPGITDRAAGSRCGMTTPPVPEPTPPAPIPPEPVPPAPDPAPPPVPRPDPPIPTPEPPDPTPPWPPAPAVLTDD